MSGIAAAAVPVLPAATTPAVDNLASQINGAVDNTFSKMLDGAQHAGKDAPAASMAKSKDNAQNTTEQQQDASEPDVKDAKPTTDSKSSPDRPAKSESSEERQESTQETAETDEAPQQTAPVDQVPAEQPVTDAATLEAAFAALLQLINGQAVPQPQGQAEADAAANIAAPAASMDIPTLQARLQQLQLQLQGYTNITQDGTFTGIMAQIEQIQAALATQAELPQNLLPQIATQLAQLETQTHDLLQVSISTQAMQAAADAAAIAPEVDADAPVFTGSAAVDADMNTVYSDKKTTPEATAFAAKDEALKVANEELAAPPPKAQATSPASSPRAQEATQQPVPAVASDSKFAGGSNANADAGSQQGNPNSNTNAQQNAAPVSAVAGVPQHDMRPESASFKAALAQAGGLAASEQVSVHIKSMAKTGDTRITIQLDPAELGKLDIRLDISQGKAVLSITADNKQTLDLLQRDARTLERALSDAGLKSDSGSLNFSLSGGDQQHKGAHDYRYGSGEYKRGSMEELEQDLQVSSITNYTVKVEEGLDICA